MFSSSLHLKICNDSKVENLTTSLRMLSMFLQSPNHIAFKDNPSKLRNNDPDKLQLDTSNTHKFRRYCWASFQNFSMKSFFLIKERVFGVEKCILKYLRLGDSLTMYESRSMSLQHWTFNIRSSSMGLKSTSTSYLDMCCNSMNERPWTSFVPYITYINKGR